MDTTTPSLVGFELIKDLIPWMFKAFEEAKAQEFRMIWNVTVPYVLQHLLEVIGILLIILLVAFLTWLVTDRWFMLGRVLYTYLHGGVLLLIGVIWGPELYANDIFEIINLVTYMICFIFVGTILDRIGARKRW